MKNEEIKLNGQSFIKETNNGWVNIKSPVHNDSGFSKNNPNFFGDPGFSRDTFDVSPFNILVAFFGQVCQQNLSDRLTQISSISSSLSSICASEDSSLSNSYGGISNTTDLIANKMRDLFNDLSSELNMYMEETISNETLTSQELDKINSSLENVNSSIQSINWK